MPLYLLEWDNGEEYNDHEVSLLGVYTSADLRKAAIERYSKLLGKQYPFSGYRDGRFVESEISTDTDLVKKHPAVVLDEGLPDCRNTAAASPP